MRKLVPFFVMLLVALAFSFYYQRREAKVSLPEGAPAPSVRASATPESGATPETSLPAPSPKLEPEDQRKMSVLQQILASHNDNDPRMDTELKDLNPAVKKAMMEYYQEIPAEKRNDRATIAFLIGRKMSDQTDVDFLKSILMEKPCLSLADCKKQAEPATGEAAHLEGINETTAILPQLHTIRAFINQYRELMGQNPPNQALADQILSALRDATHSPSPKIAGEAENALHSLNH